MSVGGVVVVGVGVAAGELKCRIGAVAGLAFGSNPTTVIVVAARKQTWVVLACRLAYLQTRRYGVEKRLNACYRDLHATATNRQALCDLEKASASRISRCGSASLVFEDP